jgi:hypothetical protein
MQDICILCGKEVERGGYSSKIGELVLRPLCSSCDELCSLDSKRVVEEHRELFEKMFAERRESLERRLSPVEPTITSAVPSRSQRERGLVKRYDDAYLVAKGTVVIGKTIRIVGIVFAVLVALGAFFSMTELKGDSAIGPCGRHWCRRYRGNVLLRVRYASSGSRTNATGFVGLCRELIAFPQQ